jgi:hypothetical protein
MKKDLITFSILSAAIKKNHPDNLDYFQLRNSPILMNELQKKTKTFKLDSVIMS